MKLSAEIQKFGAPAVGLTLNQFYEEETMHKGLSEGWCTYRDSQVEIQRERARERERENDQALPCGDHDRQSEQGTLRRQARTFCFW